MSWHVAELRESVQVFPSEEHGHVLALDCWCGPRVAQVDERTGELYRKPLISHRACGDQLDAAATRLL